MPSSASRERARSPDWRGARPYCCTTCTISWKTAPLAFTGEVVPDPPGGATDARAAGGRDPAHSD